MMLSLNFYWFIDIIYRTILETEKGIFEAILEAKLDLESAPWPSISAVAKDLIRKMLTYDPKKRISASEALGMYVIAFSRFHA